MTRIEYANFEDSSNTQAQVQLIGRSTLDTAWLSITASGPRFFVSEWKAHTELTVYDAMILREALDQFIANAVGANV